jgi:nitrite reductase (NO-forming)
VNAHERIRVWVLDAGPSKPTSFHIIGTVFDTTFQEGSYSLRPDATHGGAQALGLQASQGGFVELSFDADGTYPFVTHAFADAARGAAGAFHVGNGTMSGMKH